MKFFASEENHKKNDDIITQEEKDTYVQMEENQEQNTQEFIEQTLEYYKQSLGRPLKYVVDLRFGLGRTGDGVEYEILWWVPLDYHPIGAMLLQNPQIPAKCLIETDTTVAVYTEPNVKICMDEIILILASQRSIKLIESDEEKEPTTIATPVKSD